MSKMKEIISLFFLGLVPKKHKHKVYKILLSHKNKAEIDNVLFDEWNALEVEANASTMESYQEVVKKSSINNRRFFNTFTKIAAIFLMLLACTAVTYYFSSHNDDNNEMEEIYASAGNIEEITLSDGSKVILNSGTTLIYPKNFSGKQRTVYLNGEGSFEVAHNAKMPFIVSVNGAKIKVLGTVFNVKAYSDDANIITTLTSGSVQMEFEMGKHSPVVLNASQELSYNKINDTYSLQSVNTSLTSYWQKQHLIFRSTNMPDAFKMLERRFGVKIYISTEKYDNERITASFSHSENLEETLDIFANIIPNFKYKINENKVIIY